MKNIHLLPTNKPSRLYTVDSIGKLDWSEGYLHQVDGATNQNIYITSDEEIKEGDYAYHKTFGVGKIININGEDCFVTIKLNPKDGSITTPWKRNIPDIKKIILTTDQDLIKDGVQAIPDEFLQWFVKNPSCEEVEVEIESKFDRVDGHYHDVWEIIIPSKDDLKIGDNTNFGIITDINEKSVCFGKNKVGVDVWYKKSYVVKFPNLVLEEPKQETLEEAKIKHTKFCIENNIENPSFSFDKGAKWQQENSNINALDFEIDSLKREIKVLKHQQERSYSDKEVKHLMTLAFEQGFKKADVVEAGLEAKETDTEVNWIFLKHKK